MSSHIPTYPSSQIPIWLINWSKTGVVVEGGSFESLFLPAHPHLKLEYCRGAHLGLHTHKRRMPDVHMTAGHTQTKRSGATMLIELACCNPAWFQCQPPTTGHLTVVQGKGGLPHRIGCLEGFRGWALGKDVIFDRILLD